MAKTKRSRKATTGGAGAPAPKKRPPVAVAGRREVDGEEEGEDAELLPQPPFIYKLICSLRDYHERVDSTSNAKQQLQALLLQHQLTDRHALCRMLLLLDKKGATGSGESSSSSATTTAATTATTTGGGENSSDADDAQQHAYCYVYWLVLATQCLQKLVMKGVGTAASSSSAPLSSSSSSSAGAASVAAAWLSYTVTRALLSHLPAKQERLTSAAARYVAGRALVAVGTAAAEALHCLSSAAVFSPTSAEAAAARGGGGGGDEEGPSQRILVTASAAVQACVLALDSVTMAQPSGTTTAATTAAATATATSNSGPQVYWNQTVTSWDDSLDAVWTEHSDELQSAMLSSSQQLDWSLEEKCWQALMDVTSSTAKSGLNTAAVLVPAAAAEPSSTTSAAGKRASRRGSSHAASSAGSTAAANAGAASSAPTLLHSFEQLLRQDSTRGIGLDGRLALKRWTAVGLTWYGSGQEKLLTAALRLLQGTDSSAWTTGKCVRTVVVGPLPPPPPPTTSSEEEDAVEEVVAAPTEEPPATKSKKKEKPKSQEPEQDVIVVPVPSNVTLIALVCRICRIVWEIGNSAGTRPPAGGGYDTYMKAVTGTVLKKGKKLVRADLRDLAMIVSYHLIQRHHVCLGENYSSSERLVVNEDAADECRRRIPSSTAKKLASDSDDVASYQSLYFYYPFVQKAVDELANAAATNAAGHTVTLLYRWSDRIEYAACAFVFQAQQHVLDARLTNYAVSKLFSCLSSKTTTMSGLTADTAVSSTAISSSSGTSLASSPKKKKDALKLDQPLPVPSLPQNSAKQAASRKRKAAAAASSAAKDATPFCSFAGVYDERPKGGDNNNNNTEMSCDEKLALFVRAMRGESALSSHLIWIVEACYDTRTTEDPTIAPSLNSVAFASSITEDKKRKADTSSSGRSSKRRKKSAASSSSKAKLEHSAVDQQSELPYRPIKGVRAGVAAEALDALQLFLREPLLDSSLSEVQATLREAITIEQIYRLIDLGNTVEEIVVKPREKMASIAGDDNIPIFNATKSLFSQEEKTLWSSHMNVCITLGRGHVTYDDTKVSVLGNLRLTVYQKIAEQSKRRSSPTAWPLWLPPAHRILMSASLTSEPAVLQAESTQHDADRFVVTGFMAELSSVLQDVSSLSGSSEPQGYICAAEEIAVSLHDAKIFLAAFARLSPEEQASLFSSLLTTVDGSVAHMRASSDAIIGENNEVSAFVARVITLCVGTYLMVRFGIHARVELHRGVGKSLSSRAPSLRARSELYIPDRCFMGVFMDWEDSDIPCIPVSPKSIDGNSEKTLQRVLENALALGYATATTDKCHLLYASWNALGKCDLWNEIPMKLQQFTVLPVDLSCLILQLRDEMCLIQRKIKRVHGEVLHDTTLMRVIEAKERANAQQLTSAVEVKILLREMIKKASELIDALLLKFVPSDTSMDQYIPPEVFCLLEACAVYISFAVSSYTKPSCDFFSSTMLSMSSQSRNRARGYSTYSEAIHCEGESEALHSEGGSIDSQDALVDTLERLQDVCECLGAVPAHPDWLDKGCRLLENVSANEAAEAAHEAQVCLTKLISFGLFQSRLSLRRAFTNLLGQRQDVGIAALASKLCWLNHYETEESSFGESPYVNEREYKSDIGEVCELDPDFLDVILSEAAGSTRHEAKATWCPHSAQRILGRFQELFRTQLVSEVESPELRASGEWEVLLAGTLTSACVNVEPGKRNAELDDDVYRLVARSERWSGVCWGALDGLVPTVALLRFGLSSVGRVSHPLSLVETSTDDFDKGSVVEEMSRDVTASNPIKEAVILTLATIARFPPSPTCEAIATHLMIDAASFAGLQGMEASTNALQALAELQDALDAKREMSIDAAPFLVERAAAVLETFGSDGQGDDSTDPRNLIRLYACLRRKGALPTFRFSTFLSQDVDPSSALSRACVFGDSDSTPGVWDWEGSKDRFMRSLLSYLWQDCLQTHLQTRGFFARAISSLVAMEFDAVVDQSSYVFELLSPIIGVFNEISDETIADLIRKDICSVYPCVDLGTELPALYQPPRIQESLCTIFAFLLALRGGCATFTRVGLVMSSLDNSYEKWKQIDMRQRECIMDLTLLYATRSGDLHGIGAKLFEDLKLKQKSKLDDSKAFENMKLFADFLEEVRLVLSKRSSASGSSLPTKRTIMPPLPDSCSYAIEKDFHEQHWYNCFSCGLTNDKGCCTLCAVVCHHGHDVSYARYSSFFCDCGGDDGTSGVATKQKCKCLSPQAREKFLKRIQSGEHDTLMTKERRGSGPRPMLSAPMCARIIKSSFALDGLAAMNGLTEKGRSAAWVRFLFECTKKRFDKWKSQADEASIFAPDRGHIGSYGLLSRKMEKALENPWTLEKLTSEAFSLLGASRSGAFQVNMSTDTAIDRMIRNRLSSNGIGRSAMDADSRGRIVIAEPNGLVFCSGLPVVNSRTSGNSGDACFSRSAMCVIGSVSIGIRIVGLRFARDCENLIYVWGTHDAKVIFMKRGLTAIDVNATLDLGLSADETGSDIVVNSHWLTGSGSCLVVGCSHYLRVFDVSQPESTVAPVATISATSCRSKIRDFAAVRISEKDTDEGIDRNEEIWKIFVLLENGSLHEATIKQDEDGQISADAALDPDRFIDIAKDTTKTDSHGYSASAPGDLSSQGASLTYLEQSSVLLYQTHASGTLALPLNEKGQTRGAFEFLPFKIPPTILEKSEDCSVTGPYTHWKELGIVRRGSGNFFRVSCAGMSSTACEPVLLCLEFNDSGAKVQELTKNSSGWFEPTQSYEGSAVFTAPFACEDSDPLNLSVEKVFVERVILCALTQSGCLLVYAEDVAAPTRASLEPARSVDSFQSGTLAVKKAAGVTSLDQSLQLLAIENLIHVTNCKDVVFHVDGLGNSENIRSKLVGESENFLMSPRREGFTLTISMCDKWDHPDTRTDTVEGSQYCSQSRESSDLVIAAVRILVGSASKDLVPRSLKVMGRVHELVPGSKRWYTFHLTAQQLAFSIRNGFVSVEIDQCLDSTSSPVLDSIEVYALERRKIERWLPSTLKTVAASIALNGGCTDAVVFSSSTTRESFRLSLMALASVNSLFGSFKPNRTEKSFLKQLVQDTALEFDQQIDDAVACLVSSLEHDEESRQSFYDKAVLAACTIFLSKCMRSLETVKNCGNRADFHRMWHSLIPSLRSCLQTAARIARLRPFNYLQAADGSIAADASKFINECLSRSISDDDLVSDFVELSLLETAVANGTPRGRFGSFDGLRSLLASPNQAVVFQACASISRFCRVCDIFTSQTMAVKYVCDSCLLFINDTRYTLLDDDHSFDLCPDCYDLGKEYVKSTKRKDDDNVIIKGKTVGESPKLTCGEVQILQPVAIQKSATEDEAFGRESVDVKLKEMDSDIPSNLSQLEPNVGAEVAHQQQLFNDFMDGLFSGIAGLLGDELRKRDSTPSSLVWLSVDLVRHSIQSGRKIDRAKRLAEAMAFGLASRLKSAMSGNRLSDECLTFLDGLTSLFAPENSVREFLLGIQTNFIAAEGTAGFDHSAILCSTHRAPVVLQKFTRGQDKDRCFLACSKDAKHKCNFFLWADQGEERRNEKQPTAPLFNEDIAKFVWELFASPLVDNGASLHLSLCAFVEKFVNRTLNQEGSSSCDAKRNLMHAVCCDLQKGFADGVLCSHGRLRDDASREILTTLLRRSRATLASIPTADADRIVVEKSLELISLIASPNTDGTTDWYPILCRILLSDKGQDRTSDNLRLLAKRSLRQLCGKNTGLSHAVCYHFVFGFQCDKLLRCAEDMLKYCVLLNEKARQCGPSWKTSDPVSFHGLKVCHLVGTEDLISEDVSTLHANEIAGTILGELWAGATKRGGSWRRFCGLRELPSGVSSSTTNLSSDFLKAPPLMALFAVACSVSFENQVKALRLINQALVRTSERKPAPAQKQADTNKPSCSDDEREPENSDVTTARLPTLYADSATPEEILDVSINDVHAFVMRFVCRGITSQIRNLSCSVAVRLCQRLDKTSQGLLFDRLMEGPLCQAGVTGKRYTDFFTVLQSLLRFAGPQVINVGRSAALVQSFFKQQIQAIRHDRANCEFMHFETKSSTSVQKKRFDLAACSSCRVHESRAKDKHGEKPPTSASSDRGTSCTSRTPGNTGSPNKTRWLSEQVSPFTRTRLDAGRDFCTSNEFCAFFSLKHRCVVSAIHAEVENPRRFVKTINFYFSPRPVEDASILKSDEFASNWQPCGVLTLLRGCSRASLTLLTPVVAANLKIEYADFYKMPGGTKASDGTLIVHCPRCTRVVTNAHGVCANCGEVAFQCRKCRHINYDRLDAFLCVECGFCASGTFQYDLTAAMATNAVAITNDHDYEKASQRAKVASRLHGELKTALTQKLLELVRGRKKSALDGGEEEERLGFIPALKRAFDGALPFEPGETADDHDHSKLTLSQLGKPGSIVKMIARAATEAADRPLSLFRTAGLSEASNSRTDGFLIRGLSGRDIDEDETASELLGGLLESSSSLSRYAGLDPADPLSRLLASVQSRRERREAEERDQAGVSSQPRPHGSNGNAKDTLDVCDRLYQLMREAEREAFELDRRCAAWCRLEKGCLAETGQEIQPMTAFEPSHCSVCASAIALQLLVLWLRLFQLDPESVVINQEMMTLLLNEDPTAQLKNLQDTKRAAVKEIALRSKQGSPLVLEALRLRLTVLQDVNVAEILGKILESLGNDADAAAPFVALAREALESNSS